MWLFKYDLISLQTLVGESTGCGWRIATLFAVMVECKFVSSVWGVLSSLLVKYKMQQLSMSYVERIRTERLWRVVVA
jgi:hypothetical protein